jgi:RNA ligase (TIGR02306 family)
MRQLASIKKITEILPIENADAIEVAMVGGWAVVVKKGLHSVGELIVYFEIDSLLPRRPEFEFLFKDETSERYRLKTIKLRGQISQGLIIPAPKNDACEFVEGSDMTEWYDILKYEPKIPACLQGMAKGNFPSWIPKTDEERVQNIPAIAIKIDRACSGLSEALILITEKLDGTSATFFYHKDEGFGVCSRNLQLKDTEGNKHWEIARKYDIENVFKCFMESEQAKSLGTIAVVFQGEIVGPNIQDNHYKLTEHQFFVFRIMLITDGTVYDKQPYDMDLSFISNITGYYKQTDESKKFDSIHTVPFVRIVANGLIYFSPTSRDNAVQYFIAMADGKSMLNSQVDREGLVFNVYNKGTRFSFKAVSNKFLLKNSSK